MQDSDVLSVSQSVLQMQLHAGPGQGVRTPAGLLLAATAHQHHQLRNIQQPSPSPSPSPSTSPTPTSTPTPSPSPTSTLTPRPKATPTPAPPSTSFFMHYPRSRWFGNIYDMWYLKQRTTKTFYTTLLSDSDRSIINQIWSKMQSRVLKVWVLIQTVTDCE